jgi:hypothetical protein
MTKKLLILLLLFCLVNKKVFSQQSHFYFNGGGSLFFPWNHYSADVAVFPAITLTPGLRLIEDKNFAFVLSFPLSIGGTFKTDTYLGIDLPAMLSLNFGSAAANSDNSKFGIILGAGAAYIDVVNFYDSESFEKVHTQFWGYRFNAGISFKSDRDGSAPAIIISFGRSINGRDAYTVGIGIHYIMSNK